MLSFFSIPEEWEQWFWVVLLFLVTVVIFASLAKLALFYLTRWAGPDFRKAAWVSRLRAPIRLMGLAVAWGIALQATPESIRQHSVSIALFKGLWVLSILWGVDRFLSSVVRLGEWPSTFDDSSRRLILTSLRVGYTSVSVLIFLDILGISITPLLASLGVGSLAVALALQDTLGNFFSGLYLLADKPVRIGDMIRLENGTEGKILRIGWRSTQILLATNSLLVVPNSKLSSSFILNYSLPQEAAFVTVPFICGHDANVDLLESLALEAAVEAIEKIQGSRPVTAPYIRARGFQANFMEWTATLSSRSFSENDLVRHEFLKQLKNKFKENQIPISSNRPEPSIVT